MVKNPPATAGEAGRFLGREDPLEEGMATHSSILAWRIPWTEEPGRLYLKGSQRVRQLSMHARAIGIPMLREALLLRPDRDSMT